MLDQEDRDPEVVADEADHPHQVLGLLRVHAGGRFVEEQELRLGRQCARDLEAALGAVREVARGRVRVLVELHDLQELPGLAFDLALLRVIGRETQDSGERIVPHVVVVAGPHVVEDRQVVEEADVLERSRDARLVDVHHALAGGVLAFKEDLAAGGLVDLGQEVEDGRLAGAVGADQADDLVVVDLQVQVVDGCQAAEIDAEFDGLEDGSSVRCVHTAHLLFLRDCSLVLTNSLLVTSMITIRITA